MPTSANDQHSLLPVANAGTNNPLEMLLTKRYCLILSGRVSAQKWCEDRAVFDGISQAQAAEFLARKYGIAVELSHDHEIPFYLNQSNRKD